MGGDCSQKLLLRRGWHSSPGRSKSSDQYEIHNSIAKLGPLRTRFPVVSFSRSTAGAAASLPRDLFSLTSSFPTAHRPASSL